MNLTDSINGFVQGKTQFNPFSVSGEIDGYGNNSSSPNSLISSSIDDYVKNDSYSPNNWGQMGLAGLQSLGGGNNNSVGYSKPQVNFNPIMSQFQPLNTNFNTQASYIARPQNRNLFSYLTGE